MILRAVLIGLSLFFSINTLGETIAFNSKNTVLLSYNKIKPNRVSFNADHLVIDVQGSSGPIVYPFESPKALSELTIKAKIDGNLSLKGEQGSKGSDDFRLRVGLVYEGQKTLSFIQKKIAAKWIKTLFDLAKGKAEGIKEVYFYNTYTDSKLKNKIRKHPLSKLLREEFSLHINKEGVIDQKITLNPDEKVLGLWISSDGDDTRSKFKITINKIEVK